MKLCFFGQGTGGNAALWFDLFNNHLHEYDDVKALKFVCRTPCTLSADFSIVRPYGSGCMPKWMYRFFAGWVARYGLKQTIQRLVRRESFDLLHLQGNYAPSINLMIMDAVKTPTVVNIYGSDFYRRYMLEEFSTDERENFKKVIRRANHITCNWHTTLRDFIRAFPEAETKSSTICWGVGDKWFCPSQKLQGWPKAQKIFLSARGIYDYNNIDVVVEAFCRAFVDKPNYKLFIVNGYGNHKHAIEKVHQIINEYHAQDQVIMRVGKWIPDEELMALYQAADYNFCFGSSDQLTVSILYGLIKNAVNILSPLPNYYDLAKHGYNSLQIIPEITVDALTDHLRNSLDLVDCELIKLDAFRAVKEFKMIECFASYVSLYQQILDR